MGKNKKLKKSIKSFEKRIEEHEEKIERYEGKDYFLIKYWEKEIGRFENFKDKKEKKLKGEKD